MSNNGDHSFKKGKADATTLLEKAVSDLADTDLEVFKVVTLALTLGLRRNEIDKLEYSMFNLEAGTLSVDDSEFLHVKSERSKGVVEVEPNLIPIIRGWQAKATGPFILESEIAPRTDSKYQHYRAAPTLEKNDLVAAQGGRRFQRTAPFPQLTLWKPDLRQARHLCSLESIASR